VSDFSLLSCMTACCVVEQFDLTIIIFLVLPQKSDFMRETFSIYISNKSKAKQ